MISYKLQTISDIDSGYWRRDMISYKLQTISDIDGSGAHEHVELITGVGVEDTGL